MSIDRRRFLQAAAASLPALANGQQAVLQVTNRSGLPLEWALGELRTALRANLRLDLTRDAGIPPEGFVVSKPASAIRISASSQLGFHYALLELADRARHGEDPSAIPAGRQTPANPIRSMTRAFVSDVEDKPWFYDRDFWRGYLTNLVTQRFNRFSLTLGLGYDFPRGVKGDYLHFPYPYLLDVPGYQVRAVPLDDSERARNLEALRFISEEAAKRGLHFQLGIWTHAYEWTDSPNSHHHITGLTPDTHGPYCREAMAMLLKECPGINGVTMRVHGESGVPEGSYSFWEMVFDGIKNAGRTIEIDMHAKGLDQRMIDLGLKTGMPVKVSPKFWAEHMGLGYQQAAIRELEMPREGELNDKYFSLSNGSRRFMRYGYGDLFQAGRKFDVLFRMWPGTQRLLLWGDPETAAGFGEAAHFAGASGVEICEPLFFKGRQGSGLPGGRCAYADTSLHPQYDWQKYEYTYRVWGRLLYDPKAEPSGWQRYMKHHFGTAAKLCETALAKASRILPLITTAHLPSASNLGCWMEIYTNMPILEGHAPVPYGDTVTPKRLGTVSPLDPQLFSSIQEFVKGEKTKYSPLMVADWLQDLASQALDEIDAATRAKLSSPEFRRLEEDVRIQAGLGTFFALQIRSAVFYESQDFKQACVAYAKALDVWRRFAERAKSVYRADITFGDTKVRRGHWADRLPAIEQDYAAMKTLVPGFEPRGVGLVYGRVKVNPTMVTHTPAAAFRPGQSLVIRAQCGEPGLKLFYRHVDQAERWVTVEMEREGASYQFTIPADYTKTAFHLQYYFAGERIFPGFRKGLSTQPYYFVKRSN